MEKQDQMNLFGQAAAPANEEQAKKIALAILKIKRRAEIERVASLARQIAHIKEETGREPLANMDEVRIKANISTDKSGEKKNNFLGCIFTARIQGTRKWKPYKNADCEYHRSNTPGSHANKILNWILTQEVWE